MALAVNVVFNSATKTPLVANLYSRFIAWGCMMMRRDFVIQFLLLCTGLLYFGKLSNAVFTANAIVLTITANATF